MKSLFRCTITAILFIVPGSLVYGQNMDNAVAFHMRSSHTSFPDTARAKGHVYDKVLYTAAEHYMDSSVFIIAPKKLDAKKTVDLVFWFHGWRNNIDSAAVKYQLINQFLASKSNAFLVFAETAKDAPDSYGGKLENPGEFRLLINDIMNELRARNVVPKNCNTGHILLAGHSGAYRVMARIIKTGQMPVEETILFDALYGETPIYLNWIKENGGHRFINIYTDHGGTDDESRSMMKQLSSLQTSFVQTEESNVTPQVVAGNSLIFIHSLHEHDKIINAPDNFRLFLENCPYLKKLR